MPKTGYKHGSGRPLGAVSRVRSLSDEQIRSEASRRDMSPLAYMLDVMNDPVVDPIRRDRMAVAVAPFVHPKADTIALGKKQAAEQEAQTVDQGTEWESLLRRSPPAGGRKSGLI
jgi:hypothetical protein